ncbi:MAG: DNA polymerase III subunit delta [Thermoflexales bacterium]|nr:DNA polymerase III subunit delta [Thermoflexales bacterium]MDW8350955.1 DNA polymerase III subunit delta [Anaerolineae bacterium]
MWYLFHGPNTLARDEEIARMKAKLAEPEVASLNVTLIERGTPLRDLIAACDAMPFLADRRLVIATGWLSGLDVQKTRAKSGQSADTLQALLAYLPTMPETTRLVFAEDVILGEDHPLVKLAADKASGGIVKRYALPSDPVKWIVERAKLKGGDISNQAAQLLAAKINRGGTGDQAETEGRLYLLKLDRELDKLVSYALGRRIESADVELLVQDEDVADIFKFVDAMGARDAEAAYRAVRGLLARGESPLVVLAHIARQTRLLIQAKENADLNSEQLARMIGVHPFVAKKALQQANRFSLSELEQAHAALLEADLAIKTGRMDELAALDVLVAALCV